MLLLFVCVMIGNGQDESTIAESLGRGGTDKLFTYSTVERAIFHFFRPSVNAKITQLQQEDLPWITRW